MKTFLSILLIASSTFAADISNDLQTIKEGEAVLGSYTDVIANYPAKKKELDAEIVNKLDAMKDDDDQIGKAAILLKACKDRKIEVSKEAEETINKKIEDKKIYEEIEFNGVTISQPTK